MTEIWESHSTMVRELKSLAVILMAFVDAWIEIIQGIISHISVNMSHPPRVRELKYTIGYIYRL